MIFSNSKAARRVLVLMLLVMVLNLAAVVVFTIATFAAGEVFAAPISKRVVQGALLIFAQDTRLAIGPNGEGFSAMATLPTSACLDPRLF